LLPQREKQSRTQAMDCRREVGQVRASGDGTCHRAKLHWKDSGPHGTALSRSPQVVRKRGTGGWKGGQDFLAHIHKSPHN